jgi:hypothetical protein
VSLLGSSNFPRRLGMVMNSNGLLLKGWDDSEVEVKLKA